MEKGENKKKKNGTKERISLQKKKMVCAAKEASEQRKTSELQTPQKST